MATKFIPFENTLVSVNGDNIFAENANLNIQADLTTVEGVTGNVIRYAPNGPIRGTFSFSHYMTGSLPQYLNPLNEISEPFSGSFGGVKFQSGYARSLSFSVEPFSPIKVNSQIEVYGELTSLPDNGENRFGIRLQSGLAHGQYSYLAGSDLGISNTTSFSYSVSTSRNPVTTIGNELPYRVTKEDVEISMSVRGEDIGNILKASGNHAVINVNLFDIYESTTPIDTFSCTGQIISQSLSSNNQGYMGGSISVFQTYLTGKSII